MYAILVFMPNDTFFHYYTNAVFQGTFECLQICLETCLITTIRSKTTIVKVSIYNFIYNFYIVIQLAPFVLKQYRATLKSDHIATIPTKWIIAVL